MSWWEDQGYPSRYEAQMAGASRQVWLQLALSGSFVEAALCSWSQWQSGPGT